MAARSLWTQCVLLVFLCLCVYLVGSAELSEAYASVQKAANTELYLPTLAHALSEHPADPYLNNLQGNHHFTQGNYELSSEFYRAACESSAYRELGYMQNLVRSQLRLVDASTAVKSLVTAIKANRTDKDMYALLLSTVTQQVQGGQLSLAQFISYVLLALPERYELWLLLTQARIPALLAIESGVSTDGAGGAAWAPLENEAALTVLGLSVFPSSPELLYLRALLHRAESGEGDCAGYFVAAARAAHSLWSSGTDLLNVVTGAFSSTATSTVNPGCVPDLSRHEVQSYQETYRTISALYSNSNSWHAIGELLHPVDTSVPNSVVGSSVVAAQYVADRASIRHLPSLQVGCSQHSSCALPGFFIADALPAVSTHFLTEAYHLEMVESGSVGLVYSSHTLEHLSHNLPPARCPSYPKPDPAVRGCSSEVQEALREWRRVLAQGGRLLVSAPDLEALAVYFVHPDTSSAERAVLQAVLFGGQHDAYDFHKTGMFYALLQELLREAGFCEVERVSGFGVFADTSSKVLAPGKPISVNVRAVAC